MRKELTDNDFREPDENGNFPPNKPDLSDLNILRTYFWFLDLQGKLKQELHPPGEYHGRPRMFIREDIVREDYNPTLLTSHLRVYSGKKLLAYTTKTMPEYKKIHDKQGFLTDYYNDDNDMRYEMRRMAESLLINNGWKPYRLENLFINRSESDNKFRKSKKVKPKNRKPVKKVIKKPIKKVVKKVIKIVHKKRR